MASTPAFSSISRIFTPFALPKTQKYLRVRSQRLHDEGNSANIVDANLNILRHRIEQMRSKERLNTRYRLENGWNYNPGYDDTHKRRVQLVESFELVTLVGSTLGLVFLSGSIFIFLLSLVLHIQSLIKTTM